MIPLRSRRLWPLLALCGVVVLALVVRRAPWPADDFRDLRDSVREHDGMALNPGHASLMNAGSGGCAVCHISHTGSGQRPQWARAETAGFGSDSIGAGRGHTGMCLSCHDGVVASALSAHAVPAQDPGHPAIPGMGSAHPVGVDYLAAARRAPDAFNDPTGNPRIVLEDGRIGCVSCHATHDQAVIAAGSVRREVCVECHRR